MQSLPETQGASLSTADTVLRVNCFERRCRWITEFLLSFDKGRETYLKPLARASLEINLLALLASGKAKLEKGWAAPEVGRVRRVTACRRGGGWAPRR